MRSRRNNHARHKSNDKMTLEMKEREKEIAKGEPQSRAYLREHARARLAYNERNMSGGCWRIRSWCRNTDAAVKYNYI